MASSNILGNIRTLSYADQSAHHDQHFAGINVIELGQAVSKSGFSTSGRSDIQRNFTICYIEGISSKYQKVAETLRRWVPVLLGFLLLLPFHPPLLARFIHFAA